MPHHPTTANRIKKIIVEHLGVSPERVLPGADLVEELGADSLDTIELVMAIEEEFRIEISDTEAEKIVTVDDAVKAVDLLLTKVA